MTPVDSQPDNSPVSVKHAVSSSDSFHRNLMYILDLEAKDSFSVYGSLTTMDLHTFSI